MAQKKIDPDLLRMKRILKALKKEYPESKCSLYYETPFQLLVATILSAQCTDARVNQVTPVLFAQYPDAYSMSQTTQKKIEKIIRSTGFYQSKAKSLLSTSKDLVEFHGGEVPKDLDALIELRGVGRKTANVVLGEAYGIPGLVVDTHVGRISRRMGFTDATNPVIVEREMMEIVPKKDWVIYSHLLIDHGRAVCTSRKAKCDDCVFWQDCPKIGVS
ncbi:MAG: endonuclease III [Bdellovibrionaceae bacterium]|nr:endonuclease III [Pseudobdellovibrionaceae bacterium]|tara:strand:- start:1551 stop:2201 length:651 start_codon:yes stop_codon:yes gene_type:complete